MPCFYYGLVGEEHSWNAASLINLQRYENLNNKVVKKRTLFQEFSNPPLVRLFTPNREGNRYRSVFKLRKIHPLLTYISNYGETENLLY